MINFNLLNKTITASLVALFSMNVHAAKFDGELVNAGDGSQYYRITKCTNPEADLTIPESLPIKDKFHKDKFYPVKAIGPNVFENNTTITSVTFPPGLEEIGSSAFEGCENLNSTNIEELTNISTIGNCAFQNCYSLSDLLIIKSQKKIYIGDYAFAHCYAISGVLIEGRQSPDDQEIDMKLGFLSFSDCHSLKTASFRVVSDKSDKHSSISCYKSIISCYSLTSMSFEADCLYFNECVAINNFSLKNVSLPSGIGWEEEAPRGCNIIQNCPSIEKISVTGIRPHDCSFFGIVSNPASVNLYYPASWDTFSTVLPKPWNQFINHTAVEDQPYQATPACEAQQSKSEAAAINSHPDSFIKLSFGNRNLKKRDKLNQ